MTRPPPGLGTIEDVEEQISEGSVDGVVGVGVSVIGVAAAERSGE